MGRIPVIVTLVAASVLFVGAVALAQEEDGRYEVTRSDTRDKPAPGRREAASHI